MTRYSILTFVMGNYDRVREPLEVSENCEYVLVTDNPSLRSDTWRIKYIPSYLNDKDGFTKSFYVRYHPFEFVDTSVCIVLDASIQIMKNLDRLVSDFIDSGKSIGLSVHWNIQNSHTEYPYWVEQRGYPIEQMCRSLAFMKAVGYNTAYKGCFETTMKIQKNDSINNEINSIVWETLLKIGNGSADRVDQSIFSAVINTLFEGCSVFPFTRSMYQSSYLKSFHHNSDRVLNVCITKKDFYLFNNPVECYTLC